MKWLNPFRRRKSIQEGSITSELWVGFARQRNSPEVLAEKASSLAPMVVAVASDLAGLLTNTAEGDIPSKLDTADQREILCEVLVLFIHWIDRASYQLLPAPSRSVFQDLLMYNIGQILAGVLNTELERLGGPLIERYNTRVEEYAAFDELAGLGNSVLWVVSSHLVRAIGLDEKSRLRVELYFAIAGAFIASFPALQVEKLLAEH